MGILWLLEFLADRFGDAHPCVESRLAGSCSYQGGRAPNQIPGGEAITTKATESCLQPCMWKTLGRRRWAIPARDLPSPQ